MPEVARAIGVADKTIRRYIASGELVAIDSPRRGVFITPAALEDFLKRWEIRR